MKKISLTILFLSVSILLNLCNFASAENFTYKVYNPKENKSYTVELGTIRLTDTGYIWCFYLKGGIPYAVVSLKTNKKNDLIGGSCTDFKAFQKFLEQRNVDLSQYKFSWREYSAGTFYREMEDIRIERAAQGFHEYNGN